MGRKVIVVTPGAKMAEIKVVNELKDLQALVGGYIEAVPVSEHFTVWVNEEGKLINLEPCLIWAKGFDILRGPVVFDGLPDDEGNTQELTQDAVVRAQMFISKNKIGA